MAKKTIPKERKILAILTNIYILTLIIIFPLTVDSTGFFHIFECKWYAHLIISSTYIISMFITIIYTLIFKKINLFKEIKLNKIHYLAIILLSVCFVSLLTSPYLNKYNLWIGIGRGEGIINVSLYIISFLLVSMFNSFQKKQLLYFSISSILLNVIALLQFIGFNPFNMYQNGIGTHNVSFMSTIGNIDFISALYCLLLPVSFTSYIFLDNKRSENIIHCLSILLGSLIISVINVQSGKLAIILTIALILPYLIKNNKRLSKFIVMIAMILIGYSLNVFLNPVYYYNTHSLKLEIQINYILILYIMVSTALIYLSKILRKTDYDIPYSKYVKKYYIGIIMVGILSIIAIYIIPFSSGFMYEIHELLHGNFDDSFGTYRIFLWKRSLSLIKEYPLLGTGPDTFAVRFMSKYTKDVLSIGAYAINDTAANVYLTNFINIGIIGGLLYIIFIFKNIIFGLSKKNEYSIILLIAIICFAIQDFFNLSIVITTPIFYLTMAMHLNILELNSQK